MRFESPDITATNEDGESAASEKQDGAALNDSPPLEGCPLGRGGRNSKNYFSLPYNPELLSKARKLRQSGNLSEVLLWNQLKNRQFRGFDFDRQKVIGNYIVYFFCTNRSVVLEIDGSSHDNKIEYDAERDAFLVGLGLTVMHIHAKDVLNKLDSVMEMLGRCDALK
jgi:very-short-patch-repair endonuclease